MRPAKNDTFVFSRSIPTPQKGSDPLNQTKLLFPLLFISLEDDSSIVIPLQPTSPGEIMSGGEGEPVEADEPEEGENDTTPAETERTISGVLASTETVTHEYLTQSGKVVRETITTSMDTTTLDFFYDDSGRPFAFNYTPEGSTPNTYYYILNLQGDVVQIIDEGGVLQAEYVYSPWGEIISAEGDLAEINPLRYRGSSTIFINCGRFSADVPVIPSSIYCAVRVQSGLAAQIGLYQSSWLPRAESCASCSVDTRAYIATSLF